MFFQVPSGPWLAKEVHSGPGWQGMTCGQGLAIFLTIAPIPLHFSHRYQLAKYLIKIML